MAPERTNEVEMATQAAKPIERWTSNQRVVSVVSILKGETSMEKVEDWILLGPQVHRHSFS